MKEQYEICKKRKNVDYRKKEIKSRNKGKVVKERQKQENGRKKNTRRNCRYKFKNT